MQETLQGQWFGRFVYGDQYGDLAGEPVEFRMFVDTVDHGKFEGKIADLDGVGSSFDVVPVNGFIKGNIISFTKHYSQHVLLDDEGNTILDESRPPIVVNYQGIFHPDTKQFAGDWDIRSPLEITALKTLEVISSGTWEMRKDD